MRVGLHVASLTWRGQPRSIGATLAATAEAAQEAGIAEPSLMDHWFQMDAFAPAEDPMREGYTSLGFIAGAADRHRRQGRAQVPATGRPTGRL